MHGLQQMFRHQNAVDRQSVDSWHSTSTNSSYTNSKVELVNEMKPWNQGLSSSSHIHSLLCLLLANTWTFIMKEKKLKNFSPQIVFSINCMKSQSRRVPSRCQLLRSKQLRNAIALATATIPLAGVVVRRIPIRWWWDEAPTSVTTILDAFSRRRPRVRAASAWMRNVSEVHHFQAIL